MRKYKMISLTGLAVMSVLVISACGKSVKTMSTISIAGMRHHRMRRPKQQTLMRVLPIRTIQKHPA